MRTTKQYHRLTSGEREEISRGLAQGHSISAIARRLARVPSSISREVQRNAGIRGYRGFSAGNRARVSASSRRYSKRRLAIETCLRSYVLVKLKKRWSPEEIVKRLQQEYPSDTTMRISHEAIYQYIYVLPRGELKRTLTKDCAKSVPTAERGEALELLKKQEEKLPICSPSKSDLQKLPIAAFLDIGKGT